MSLLVRERMPLRLSVRVLTADGTYAHRLGVDGKGADAISALSFSDTMPGGFEQAQGQLTRRVEFDYADLSEFEKFRIEGVGGLVAWEGRLESSPRVAGGQLAINPSAVGYQGVLDDNRSAREIIVDVDQTRWGPASVQRKIHLISGSIDDDDPNSIADPATGYPSLVEALSGPWGRFRACEAWYDGNGLPLWQVYYAWKLDGNILSTDTNWSWKVYMADDDIGSTFDVTSELRAAGPGKAPIVGTTATRKWAMLSLYYNAANANEVNYQLFWTALAVYGLHNLPLQGSGDYQTAPGVLAQDVVRYVVGKYAPQLATSKAGIPTVLSASTFVIPHLVFLDPTTASDMVKQASRFDLQDWAVWEGPTLYWNDYNARGRKWRARVGAAQLQDAGPQVDRIWNSVVVQYADVSGVTRTVGPVGSGCNSEDASLTDSDPTNPATVAGLTRRALVQMGTSTVPAAIKIGQTFLQQQKLRSTSGQATLVGHVQDEHGVLWPAWYVRAGDQISFVDANDSAYRRIVRKTYDDATRTATIDLDSPPDALQELLERMSISVTPIGFS